RWPISEAAATASRRTAVPPSRPATQASESASRLSSCSRATLTCSIRLPVGDELVERRRVGGGAHGVAQRAIAEHLRELGKDLQVLLGRLFGHEEHEDEGDRRAVGRVERNRLCQADEGAERLLQPLDAAVRGGDALAEAGRAEPRTCRVHSAFWRILSTVRMTWASITWSKCRLMRSSLART